MPVTHPRFLAGGPSRLRSGCRWSTASLDRTMRRRMSRTSTHSIVAQRVFEARSSEAFDRIAFALSVIRLLKPKLNVAVYPRSRHLETTRGGIAEPWAILGVPPHATRENIVRAVAELSGAVDQPFLVDLLCGFR